MPNNIIQIRLDIKNHFDPYGMIENSKEIKFSESVLFYYSCTLFRQKDESRNWIVSKIEIWDTEAAKKIFEYITDNDMSHHSSRWIISKGHEYLLLSEAQTGYSIFDISACQLYSCNIEEDPFIWMEMYLSTDGEKLMVEGCHWACPCELRVYAVENITKLPYNLLYKNPLYTSGNGFKFYKWRDERSIYFQDKENNYVSVFIPDLEAEIYYLTVEEGGRKTSVKSGYRGQFYYDGNDWDAQQEFINKQECKPGESVCVYLHTLSPQYHQEKFFVGKGFEIREGAKVVGRGNITNVIRSDFRKQDKLK